MDPRQVKYPSLSPYHSFANNPILFVDTDCKENTFYIVLLPDPNSRITKADFEEIKTRVQNILCDFGYSVNVKLLDGSEIYPTEFESIDVLVAIGERKNVANYLIDNFGSNQELKAWGDVDYLLLLDLNIQKILEALNLVMVKMSEDG